MFAANASVRAGPQLSPVSHATQAAAPPVQRSLLHVGDSTIPEQMRLAPLLGPPGPQTVQRELLPVSQPIGPTEIHAAARAGVATPAAALPHGSPIQKLFGRHNVRGVKAHVGAGATKAAHDMDAGGFAMGEHTVFAGNPDLYTAAHEAAHVIQQRAGVHLSGGVGQVGDAYERHADAVAGRVVAGQSAEELLDRFAPKAGTAPASGALQQSATGLVQRGIWKKKKKGMPRTLYERLPSPTAVVKMIGRNLSVTVHTALREVLTAAPPHRSMKAAVAHAERRAKLQGRYDTGRGGTPVTDTGDMMAFCRAKGADVSTMKTKFAEHSAMWNGLFNNLEFIQTDFKGMKSSGTGPTFWGHFTRKISTVAPTLIRTISAFNETAAHMVAHDPSAASMKGSMFEHWTLANVLSSANNRVTIKKQGSLKQSRSSDGWNPKKQTLWDMKHYKTKMGASTNKGQAADYWTIVQNGYTTTTGKVVKAVNYLFPTLDAAKANKWLATQLGFGVYYVETPSTLTKYA